MTHALATYAVPAAAAHGLVWAGAARVTLLGAVVTLGALTLRAQAPGVTQADAALVRAVATVAFGAVGLHLGLALALALKGDGDLQRVLEAHRLEGEGLRLLLGAAPHLHIHTEGHLRDEHSSLLSLNC